MCSELHTKWQMTIAEIICIQRILVIQWIYTRTESTVIEQKSREQSLEIHFIQLYSDGVSQRTLNVNVPALEENTLDIHWITHL